MNRNPLEEIAFFINKENEKRKIVTVKGTSKTKAVPKQKKVVRNLNE